LEDCFACVFEILVVFPQGDALQSGPFGAHSRGHKAPKLILRVIEDSEVNSKYRSHSDSQHRSLNRCDNSASELQVADQSMNLFGPTSDLFGHPTISLLAYRLPSPTLRFLLQIACDFAWIVNYRGIAPCWDYATDHAWIFECLSVLSSGHPCHRD
jgi:hypothetical protein